MPYRTLLICAILAIGFRYWAFSPVDTDPERGDSRIYVAIARNVAEHHVLSVDHAPPFTPTPLRPPIYPYFLAAFLGSSHWISYVRAVQVVGSVAAGLLLAVAFRKQFAYVNLVLVLALVCFCYPEAVSTGFAITESLVTTLLVLAMISPFLFPEKYGYVICGVLLGLTTLTRDVYLLLPFLLAMLLLLEKKKREAAVLLVAFMVTLAPWTIRNAVDFKQFIPVSKGLLGINLWIGTWETDGKWQVTSVFPPDAYWTEEEKRIIPPNIDQAGHMDAYLMADAEQRMLHQPLRVLKNWVRRAPYLWVGTRTEGYNYTKTALKRGSRSWFALKVSLLAYDLAVLAFAAFAFIRLWRNRYVLWLAAPVVYTAAIYFPLHNTETRYAQPVYQFLVGLAAVGATLAYRNLAESLRRRSATAA